MPSTSFTPTCWRRMLTSLATVGTLGLHAITCRLPTGRPSVRERKGFEPPTSNQLTMSLRNSKYINLSRHSQPSRSVKS
jgi:hypothetical protein